MSSFAGKVALVTGASRGLGLEVVRALAAAGAMVGAVGRDETTLEEAVAAAGGSALAIRADVAVAADAERAVQETVARFGALHLLVNGAGVMRRGTLDRFAEADWDLLFDTNVKGCYLTTKYAVPAMRACGGGAIVNVASVYALAASAGAAPYAATKAAVVALTRTAALDHVGEGIRINCVAPGTMETPMVLELAQRAAPDDPRAALDTGARTHPIGRFVEAAEVTRLILFLLSDEASAIVGSCYTIDGGRHAMLGSADSS